MTRLRRTYFPENLIAECGVDVIARTLRWRVAGCGRRDCRGGDADGDKARTLNGPQRRARPPTNAFQSRSGAQLSHRNRRGGPGDRRRAAG
jgi:hypothetical protein